MSSPTQNQSFLAAGITALSPWGSRSATPKPPPLDRGKEDLETVEPVLEQQRGRDHTVSRRNRLSLRSYPSDCPPLSIQWYHAIDAPKRKPRLSGDTPASEKPLPPPKKFIPFSKGDSRAIEALYQRLSEEDDVSAQQKLHRAASDATRRKHRDSTTFEALEGADHADRRPHEDRRKFRVPVNEDYLFDVDVEARELAPAYWLGPVYDVCRGMWFFQDSSGLRPCDENLATQLEEGYLKLQPWKFPQSQAQRSTSQARSRPVSLKADDLPNDAFQSQRRSSNPVTPKSSDENLKVPKGRGKPLPGLPDPVDAENPNPTRTLRLFGPHTNTVVTYQDASTAWLVTDSALSKLSSAMYQRFAGGGYFAGTKVVRGFNDGDDIKDEKKTATPTKSSSPDRSSDTESPKADESDQPQSPSETHRQSLERKMSALVNSVSPEDREKQEEEARKREEEEMRDDYQDQDGAGQGREIEHLLLVTHGIGQRLGLRMESVNFVHDVNTMRKTLKSVYAHSPDLQALNHEVGKLPKNSRVQVLPICWRHLLDFPKQSLKHNRQEHDLGDADGGEDDHYPNLDDITIEGVPAVRNLITDLALDILLYQSPAYKGHISRIVAAEINRIYKLFTERNPSFNGRVSLVGHSLGSAIMFDILCRQREDSVPSNKHHKARQSEPAPLRLDFDVEDFFALGSPIGLFQMLRGRTVAARRTKDFKPSDTPVDVLEDPFMTESVGDLHSKKFEITVSSPKCARLFNIFHPTDPISYRIEPLISSSMASLKPQPLPYTKKGIFGAPVGAGLTGIGARVGQSVSGLWTSFSSGIASSLLNRSLGISGEDATSMRQSIAGQNQQAHAQQQQHFVPPQPRPLSLGAGTNIASAGVVPAGPVPAGSQPPPPPNATHVPQRQFTQNDITTGEDGEHPPTLIDTELETLWSGWEKKRRASGMSVPGEEGGGAGDHAERDEEWRALEEQARRLRREEAKVRALNANGRVDYSIQEGAFDISLLASIASHLSYWADEDVSHFMVSQLLARHRVLKESVKGENVRV